MSFDVLVGGHLSRLGTKEDVQATVDFFADILAGSELGHAAVSLFDIALGIGVVDPAHPLTGHTWCVCSRPVVDVFSFLCLLACLFADTDGECMLLCIFVSSLTSHYCTIVLCARCTSLGCFSTNIWSASQTCATTTSWTPWPEGGTGSVNSMGSTLRSAPTCVGSYLLRNRTYLMVTPCTWHQASEAVDANHLPR